MTPFDHNAVGRMPPERQVTTMNESRLRSSAVAQREGARATLARLLLAAALAAAGMHDANAQAPQAPRPAPKGAPATPKGAPPAPKGAPAAQPLRGGFAL